MRVLQFPLIKITACFVLGLLLAHFAKPAFLFSLIALVSSLMLLVVIYFYSKSKLIPNATFGDCKPKLIIADGSNSKFNVRLWKATCEKEKIPFHNTVEKGFYKL